MLYCGKIFIMRVIFLLLPLFLVSCAFPKYTQTTIVGGKLNISSGKWIVNNVESPEGTSDNIIKIISGGFAIDSIIDLNTLSLKYPVPYEIPFDLDSSAIDKIRLYTKYDYIINVKARIIDNNTSIHFNDLNAKFEPTSRGYVDRKSEVKLKIYDIKNHLIVYSDDITADINYRTNDFESEKIYNSRINISPKYVKTAKRLIYSALRKSMKTLKKNSR